MLDEDHYFKNSIIQSISEKIKNIKRVKEIYSLTDLKSDYIKKAELSDVDLSTGNIYINLNLDEEQYYIVLSDLTGIDIQNEYSLIKSLKECAKIKEKYSRLENAVTDVYYKGYGVVTPSKDEIILGEPEITRAGNKFGIKIKAEAPSVHMIKTNVITEIAPLVGNEDQANDLINYIKANGESGMFDTNIFGKSIEQIVEEGIKNKLQKLSDETQEKLKNTLEKITNESNGGVICIII